MHGRHVHCQCLGNAFKLPNRVCVAWGLKQLDWQLGPGGSVHELVYFCPLGWTPTGWGQG
jgi:hypothetical protein